MVQRFYQLFKTHCWVFYLVSIRFNLHLHMRLFVNRLVAHVFNHEGIWFEAESVVKVLMLVV